MMSRRPAVLVLLAAAAVTVLSACGTPGARLTYNDTEKVKVTEIVMSGGSGDVTVRTAAIEETRINRVVRSSHDPGQSYRLDGTVLHVDTDCGSNCTVSYEIEAPAGVAVRGELSSGDVGLIDIGTADFALTSGNVMIQGATGPVKVRATSGDVDVFDAEQGATLEVTSGNLRAMNVSGPVDAKASSGDIDVKLAEVGSVNAVVNSGDVSLLVPEGAYRLLTDAGSGDEELAGITNDSDAENVLNIRTGSGDVRIVQAPPDLPSR